MIKHLLLPSVLGALSITLLPVGCSDGLSCDGALKCANDPKPSSEQIQTCKDSQKGSCADKFMALRSCFASAGCTAAGMTDTSKCATEANAYTSCLTTSDGGTIGNDSGSGGNDSSTGNDSAVGNDSGMKDAGPCLSKGHFCQRDSDCCSHVCDLFAFPDSACM
jgi:hypothetical protein